MSTITKEFTKEQLQQIIETDHVQCGEASALARIALASLEAEPAIHRWRRVTVEPYGLYPWHYGNFIGFSKPVEGIEDEYYYSAPPAPVSVPDDVMAAMQKVARIRLDLNDFDGDKRGILDCLSDAEEALIEVVNRRAAMLQGADGNSPVIPDCSCGTCRPVTFTDSRFVVCSECGNKRCPHANDHRNACTGSNEPGQEGSAYPAAPQQEVK
ncbi:hypothetical protein [Enterobacter hormaechei]|uniref:hypothetical protein n=1 Tax=Enterobacter hormaechei TaxID=158836 RepID=UPI001BD52534|nr:hypothetical protein [Enterobacter hormaechei]